MKVNRALFEQLIREELEAVLSELTDSDLRLPAYGRKKSPEIIAMLKGGKIDCDKLAKGLKVSPLSATSAGWGGVVPSPWTKKERDQIDVLQQHCKGILRRKKWDANPDDEEGEKAELAHGMIKLIAIEPAPEEINKEQEIFQNLTPEQQKQERKKVKSFWKQAVGAFADASDNVWAELGVSLINDELYFNTAAIGPYRAWLAAKMPRANSSWWKNLKKLGFRLKPGTLGLVASNTADAIALATAKRTAFGRLAAGSVGGIFRQLISGPVGLVWAAADLFASVLDLVGNWRELTNDIDKRPMEYKQVISDLRDKVEEFVPEKDRYTDIFTHGGEDAKNLPAYDRIDLAYDALYRLYIEAGFRQLNDIAQTESGLGGMGTVKGGAGEGMSALAASLAVRVHRVAEHWRVKVYRYWVTGPGREELKKLKDTDKEKYKLVMRRMKNLKTWGRRKKTIEDVVAQAQITQVTGMSPAEQDARAAKKARREKDAWKAQLRDPTKKPDRPAGDVRTGRWMWDTDPSFPRGGRWIWYTRAMTKEEEYKKDLRREEMRLRGNAAKKRQREKILQQIRDIDKRQKERSDAWYTHSVYGGL